MNDHSSKAANASVNAPFNAAADPISRFKRGEVSAAYKAAVAWSKSHPNPCAPIPRARKLKNK